MSHRNRANPPQTQSPQSRRPSLPLQVTSLAVRVPKSQRRVNTSRGGGTRAGLQKSKVRVIRAKYVRNRRSKPKAGRQSQRCPSRRKESPLLASTTNRDGARLPSQRLVGRGLAASGFVTPVPRRLLERLCCTHGQMCGCNRTTWSKAERVPWRGGSQEEVRPPPSKEIWPASGIDSAGPWRPILPLLVCGEARSGEGRRRGA
jgi:hypothetical protein